MMNTAIVKTDNPKHNHTSTDDKDKIETEPNNVEHTSAQKFDEGGNLLINR